MPWCPVCKNEYREGFTTCAECKVDLVESLEDVPVAVYFGNERELTKIVDFLKANDIKDAFLQLDEKDGQYELLVKKEHEKAAKRMIQIFYRELQSKRIELEDILEEDEEDDGEQDEIQLEADETLEVSQNGEVSDSTDSALDFHADDMEFVYSHGEDEVKPHMSDMERMQQAAMELKKQEKKEVFEDQHNRADDYKSSGQALLFVGILGIAFLLVNVLGILPFQLAGIAQYVVLAMCLFFIIYGAYSLKESKKIEKQAGDDDEIMNQMQTYLKENLSKETLDAKFDAANDAAEEQLYFGRTECIREALTKQFGEKYQPIIDKITDDYYEELYS